MPQENTFDVRIAHSSPLFSTSPLTGDQKTGWATKCTASGYPCDGPNQSAVYTTFANAAMVLEFYGSRIELHGNATGGMEIAWELDGKSRTPDADGVQANREDTVGEDFGGGLLGVFGGLDSGSLHKLSIVAKPSLPSAVMAFHGAVVTVGTGVVGGTLSRRYLDDTDPSLQYTQTAPGWASYAEYESPSFNITRPTGVTNTQFQSTKVPGTSVSLTFNGTQVLLYGPCYRSNGAYTITLDKQPPVVYNASINAYSQPQAASVAGACLRYISPPLSSNQPHYVSMANNDQDRETNLDWVLVVGNSGGESISRGSKNKPNIGAIVGAVVGSVALLLTLVALFFLIRRRRHRAQRVTTFAASDKDTDDRKATALDLLSARSDVPSLLGDSKPNVLVSPSHGSGTEGNQRTYRMIEPFELPPFVEGIGHGKRKSGGGSGLGAGPEFSPSITDSDAMQSQQDNARANAAAPATVPMVTLSTEAAPAATSTFAPIRTHAPPPSATSSTSAQQSHVPNSALYRMSTTTEDVSLPQRSQPQPQPQQAQAQNPAVLDLSQISSDVNRILAQLGQIRRRTDSNVANGVRNPVGEDDEESLPSEAPPQYGKHRRV